MPKCCVIIICLVFYKVNMALFVVLHCIKKKKGEGSLEIFGVRTKETEP